MEGLLIGINEAIASSSGGNVGVGFAVPVNFIRPLLRAAMNRSMDVERVWDGISAVSCSISTASDVGAADEENHIRFGRVFPRGIQVRSIHKKSPAARAGVQRGDVILSVDAVQIDDVNTYYLLIAGVEPDAKLRYRIIREVDGSYHRKQRRQKQRQREQQRKRVVAERQRRRRSRSPGRGGRRSAAEDGDGDDDAESVVITPHRRRALADISWADFAKFEDIEIEVAPQLIPPPTKKPLEVKDRMNPFYGCDVVELCPAINSDFALDFAESGVAIWDIERGSQAERLGFKIGDVIVSVDNRRVRTLEDVEAIGEKMAMRKNCRIRYKRNGRTEHVDVYLRARKRYHSRM